MRFLFSFFILISILIAFLCWPDARTSPLPHQSSSPIPLDPYLSLVGRRGSGIVFSGDSSEVETIAAVTFLKSLYFPDSLLREPQEEEMGGGAHAKYFRIPGTNEYLLGLFYLMEEMPNCLLLKCTSSGEILNASYFEIPSLGSAISTCSSLSFRLLNPYFSISYSRFGMRLEDEWGYFFTDILPQRNLTPILLYSNYASSEESKSYIISSIPSIRKDTLLLSSKFSTYRLNNDELVLQHETPFQLKYVHSNGSWKPTDSTEIKKYRLWE